MGIKRHKPEEIVTKLRQVEVLVGQGMARIDAIREVCITEQTFYRWRRKYADMELSDMRKLKEVQEENRRLKALVADQALNIEVLLHVGAFFHVQ